jgi:hypothetical protein
VYAVAAGLALVVSLAFAGASDRWRRGLYWLGLVALMAATAALGWAGFQGRRVEAEHVIAWPVRAHLVLGCGVSAAVLGAMALRRRGGLSGDMPPVRGGRTWGILPGFALATAAGGGVAAGLFGHAERATATLAQPRDLAHTIAAGGLVLGLAALLLVPRGRRRGRISGTIGALMILSLVVLAWTGVVMLFDGSDRGAGAWRFRGTIVQTPGDIRGD